MWGNDMISSEKGALMSLNEGYSDNVRTYLRKFETEPPSFFEEDKLRRALLISLTGGLTPFELGFVIFRLECPDIKDHLKESFWDKNFNQQKNLLKILVEGWGDKRPEMKKYYNIM